MPTSSFKGNEVLGLGSLVGQCSSCRSGSETSVDASLTATPLTYVELAEFPRIEPSAPGPNHCNGGH